ncbi:MAG: hypothetical protein RLY40_1154, partial [Pseudomonadota bacterium]
LFFHYYVASKVTLCVLIKKFLDFSKRVTLLIPLCHIKSELFHIKTGQIFTYSENYNIYQALDV